MLFAFSSFACFAVSGRLPSSACFFFFGPAPACLLAYLPFPFPQFMCFLPLVFARARLFAACLRPLATGLLFRCLWFPTLLFSLFLGSGLSFVLGATTSSFVFWLSIDFVVFQSHTLRWVSLSLGPGSSIPAGYPNISLGIASALRSYEMGQAKKPVQFFLTGPTICLVGTLSCA